MIQHDFRPEGDSCPHPSHLICEEAMRWPARHRILRPNDEPLRELRDIEGKVLTFILAMAGVWMCLVTAALVDDRGLVPPERVLDEQQKRDAGHCKRCSCAEFGIDLKRRALKDDV